MIHDVLQSLRKEPRALRSPSGAARSWTFSLREVREVLPAGSSCSSSRFGEDELTTCAALLRCRKCKCHGRTAKLVMAKAGGAFTVLPRLQVQSSGATVPQKLADNLVRSELHELKKGMKTLDFIRSWMCVGTVRAPRALRALLPAPPPAKLLGSSVAEVRLRCPGLLDRLEAEEFVLQDGHLSYPVPFQSRRFVSGPTSIRQGSMGCLKRITSRLSSLCSRLFPFLYDCLFYCPQPKPRSEIETVYQDKVDVERQIRKLRSSITRRRNLAQRALASGATVVPDPQAILQHYEKVLLGLEERLLVLNEHLARLQGDKFVPWEVSASSSISTSPTLSGAGPRPS
ncbi:unnamed protein product [Symbiodinium necroappetens]|uniref:Uncharacterized protein n=1 Tax=Symbiodinium necroappetens TaxID=1628268 RepID=A0A812J790_9DINO|nr:unnamed protein product [Symbiodinium necroappetens]